MRTPGNGIGQKRAAQSGEPRTGGAHQTAVVRQPWFKRWFPRRYRERDPRASDVGTRDRNGRGRGAGRATDGPSSRSGRRQEANRKGGLFERGERKPGPFDRGQRAKGGVFLQERPVRGRNRDREHEPAPVPRARAQPDPAHGHGADLPGLGRRPRAGDRRAALELRRERGGRVHDRPLAAPPLRARPHLRAAPREERGHPARARGRRDCRPRSRAMPRHCCPSAD